MKQSMQSRPYKKGASPILVDRKRLVIVAVGVFVLFSVLIAQFYRIQIIEGLKWSRVADRQHFFVVREPFVRGSFVSNTSIKRAHVEKPQYFAVDIEKFHLYIDPESIPKSRRDEIAGKIKQLVHLTLEEHSALRAQFNFKSRSRKLSMWLDRETRDGIMAWWTSYARQKKIVRNALFFVSDYQRSYPFGKLLGQVLHTIQSNKDSLTMQALPTGGLELYFNRQLRGKLGKRRLMRSPRHSLELGEVVEQPQNGADIYLTINHYLQAIAEEELAKGVKKSQAKGGWAMMMDPHSGEILALAQYPFFYPPDYAHYFNDPKLIDNTCVKAVSDAIEPGSVMKPFTLAVGLLANVELLQRGEKPLFNPLEKMATSNGRFAGRSKNLTDTHLHNYLNMSMALQKSSNIYMARVMEKVVERLGNAWYRKVLTDVFGFGEKTGIELPGETKGVVPAIGKKHPNGALEWSAGTPYSLAMGYNIQVNSAQMLRAYAVFANGGYLVQPTLVKKIARTDEHGQTEVLLDRSASSKSSTGTLTGSQRQCQPVLDARIVKEVVSCMKYTTKPGGSARRADIPGYSDAGKTSTAKKIVNGMYSETLYRGTFIGFAPVENPAFILLVVMDEPEYKFIPGIGKNHHGGTCAAPVFRDIGKRTLEYLGITPDDPCGYPVGDPRYNPAKADWIKECNALQELYKSWNGG